MYQDLTTARHLRMNTVKEAICNEMNISRIPISNRVYEYMLYSETPLIFLDSW